MVQKWEVMITKGDSEPWWFFSDWKKDVMATYLFSDKKSALEQYKALFQRFCSSLDHMKIKNTSMAAFWKDGDMAYCEPCDEDLQIYYGLLIFCNGEPYYFSKDDEMEIFGKKRAMT